MDITDKDGGDYGELGRGGGKPAVGAELLSSLSDIESQLAVSDSAKNQQAAAVLQERVLSSEGPADYYALASKAVEAQYGELPQTDSDALVGVVLGQTAIAIDADIASLTDKIGDDALQQDEDLQHMLQSQHQLLQMLSNTSNNTSIPGPPDSGLDPSPSSPPGAHRYSRLGGLAELFSNMQSNMDYDPNRSRGSQDSMWAGSTTEGDADGPVGDDGEPMGEPMGEPSVDTGDSSGDD